MSDGFFSSLLHSLLNSALLFAILSLFVVWQSHRVRHVFVGFPFTTIKIFLLVGGWGGHDGKREVWGGEGVVVEHPLTPHFTTLSAEPPFAAALVVQ